MIPPHTNRYPKPPSGAATGWGRFFCVSDQGERAAKQARGPKDTWAVMARWRAGHARPLRGDTNGLWTRGAREGGSPPLCSGRGLPGNGWRRKARRDPSGQLARPAPLKGEPFSPAGVRGRLAAHNERRQFATQTRSCGCLPHRGKHCSLPSFAALNCGPALATPQNPTQRWRKGRGR